MKRKYEAMTATYLGLVNEVVQSGSSTGGSPIDGAPVVGRPRKPGLRADGSSGWGGNHGQGN